ncbi:MAG: hypothetical protein AAFX81_11765 [Pseudomonadota bacterium]
MRLSALVLGLIVLSVASDAAAAAGTPGSCERQFTWLDGETDRLGVRDAEARPIPGFPYLRADRYAASWRDEVATEAAFHTWVHRLADLDRAARVVERHNLPPANRHGVDLHLGDQLDGCREVLISRDLGSAKRRAALRSAVRVADSYSVVARTAGLYPLTALGVAFGYQRWVDANLGVFDIEPTALPVKGTLVRWGPGERSPPPELGRLPRDPLGHPILDQATFEALAHAHAPVFVVDQAGAFDLPGAPYPGPPPGVDPSRPEVSVRLAFQRSDDGPLVQLVYTLWFDERPAAGRFDLLAGTLDGLMWRVTLDDRGRVLVHDTIHACGCYHLAFPVPPVTRAAMPEDSDLREGLLAPAPAPLVGPNERLTVRVASGSHYVVGLSAAPAKTPDEHPYRLVADLAVPDRLMRITQSSNTTASLYREDALVAGSERGERYTLWPMGVVEPGAMRQWGHHATAFVGRRHFDDPWLIDGAFDW